MAQPYIKISKWLPDDVAECLLLATVKERKWMVDASTGGRDDYRSAQVLYTPVDDAHHVTSELERRLRGICEALQIVPFAPSRVETQMTIYGDGDLYQRHTDSVGAADVAPRTLSFVYYFHRRPKRFCGGELVLFLDGGEEAVVEPTHNSIIVFISETEHEVLAKLYLFLCFHS